MRVVVHGLRIDGARIHPGAPDRVTITPGGAMAIKAARRVEPVAGSAGRRIGGSGRVGAGRRGLKAGCR